MTNFFMFFVSLQRLMKHTEAEHGDLSLLRRAEREIHEFALKIDAIQKETNEQASNQLKNLKNFDTLIYGLYKGFFGVWTLAPSAIKVSTGEQDTS